MVIEEPLDLSHLHAAAQQVARLPAGERLRYGAGRPVDRLHPCH
jgi:hypothetical protein